MNFFTSRQLWQLAYRNLWRNKRRTFSTALAILAGYAGLILLSAYIFRVQRGLETSTVYLNHKGHIAIFKKDALQEFFTKPKKYALTAEDQKQISEILNKHSDKIEFTGKYLSGMALLSNGRVAVPVLATGFEPEAYSQVYHHPELERWTPDWTFKEDNTNFTEFKKDPRSISITTGLGELIGRAPPFDKLSEGDRNLQLAAKSYFNDLNAVNANLSLHHTTGMALAEDTSLYAPLSLLQELFATDGIQYWAVFLKDRSDMGRVMTDLKKDFESLPFEAFPFNNETWSPYYVGSMSFLYVMATFFVFLICSAVALSIINSTTLGILERIREIGTLRAIGFEPRNVADIFLKENLLVSFISIFFGQMIGVLIATAVNKSHIMFSPPGAQGQIQFRLVMNPFLCLMMALMVVLINILTTFFVVRGVNRKQIVYLLSETGA